MSCVYTLVKRENYCRIINILVYHDSDKIVIVVNIERNKGLLNSRLSDVNLGVYCTVRRLQLGLL